MKEKTQQYYDKNAENYNSFIDYDTRVRILKEIFKRIKNPYIKALDLACGTGAVIDALFAEKKISITGVDLSEKMLAIAKKRFDSNPNVHFMQGNFLTITFPPASFDLVIIAHAIRFVPKGLEEKFVNNIYKWLRKNGVFIVVRYEPIQIPFFYLIKEKIFNLSSINHKKGLIKIMQQRLMLKDSYQSKVLFQKSTHYRPSRVKAYFFKKRI